MKLEPVGHINAEQLGALIAGNEDQATITSDWKLPSDTPLYTIPEGYVVVPVEPTAAMNFAAYDECQRVSTVQIGLATAAKIYKAMIAAKEVATEPLTLSEVRSLVDSSDWAKEQS